VSVVVVAFALDVPEGTTQESLAVMRSDLQYVLEVDPRYAGKVEILDAHAKHVPDLEWLRDPPIFRSARAAWFSDAEPIP
jgi:hypothetical protein